MNTESFVLYESVYKQLQILEKRLGKETAYDYIKAIMEFGLYGVIPEEDSEVWLYGFEQSITSIGNAKARYEKAVENGKKGGRKAISLDEEAVMAKKQELKTWKAVAEFFGIDEDTLRKYRKQWDKKTEKPKNLNDNVNDNVNVNTVSSVSAGAETEEIILSPEEAEQGTLANPIEVSKEWLIERKNELRELAVYNLYQYGNKYYRMKMGDKEI